METFEIHLKMIRGTKINKTSRNIVNLIFIIRKLLNVPDRRVMTKISDRHASFDKKSLTKSIVTEILTRNGVQTVNVKTDIDFKYLCKIS